MRREALTKLQAAMIVAVVVCAAVIGVYAWGVTRRKVVPPTPSPSPTPTPTPIERALKRVRSISP